MGLPPAAKKSAKNAAMNARRRLEQLRPASGLRALRGLRPRAPLPRRSEGCKLFSLKRLVRPRTRQDRRLNLPHWVEIAALGRTSAMFALTRAGFAVAIAAALFAVAPFSAKAADKPFRRQRSRRQRGSARRPDQVGRRRRHQAGGANPQRRRRRLCQERFPHRHDAARPDRRRAAQRRHHLAAHGAHRHADPPGQRPGARDAARARLDRGLHRL